jgi:hypothetical protein
MSDYCGKTHIFVRSNPAEEKINLMEPAAVPNLRVVPNLASHDLTLSSQCTHKVTDAGRLHATALLIASRTPPPSPSVLNTAPTSTRTIDAREKTKTLANGAREEAGLQPPLSEPARLRRRLGAPSVL